MSPQKHLLCGTILGIGSLIVCRDPEMALAEVFQYFVNLTGRDVCIIRYFRECGCERILHKAPRLIVFYSFSNSLYF